MDRDVLHLVIDRVAAQLDPEDMGDLLRAFQRVVGRATRFDGHVARWTGTGRPRRFWLIPAP